MTNFIFYSLILLLLKCHSKHIKQGTRGKAILSNLQVVSNTQRTLSSHTSVSTKLYLNAEGVSLLFYQTLVMIVLDDLEPHF